MTTINICVTNVCVTWQCHENPKKTTRVGAPVSERCASINCAWLAAPQLQNGVPPLKVLLPGDQKLVDRKTGLGFTINFRGEIGGNFMVDWVDG